MTTAKSPPTGVLAWRHCRRKLPLRVLRSAAGWYLGTVTDDGYACSRESLQYWNTEAEAAAALASGEWLQRLRP